LDAKFDLFQDTNLTLDNVGFICVEGGIFADEAGQKFYVFLLSAYSDGWNISKVDA